MIDRALDDEAALHCSEHFDCYSGMVFPNGVHPLAELRFLRLESSERFYRVFFGGLSSLSFDSTGRYQQDTMDQRMVFFSSYRLLECSSSKRRLLRLLRLCTLGLV